MTRILIPSPGPDAWKQFLAKPELHWAVGYSARTLAHSWEAADGIPPEVGSILDAAFGPTRMLLAIPERKTPLPGGTRESQSDVFMLAPHADGVVACTIEGKVDEPFGPTVGEWSKSASPGKTARLDYLCELLGLETCPLDVHYQLLHRTASALIEAQQFGARDAAMIVHSFSPERRWFDAYERFCLALGCGKGRAGVPSIQKVPDGRRLGLGWASGEQRFREM